MMSNVLTPALRSKSDDGMIPLINIVFLLLIFFMIAGQIDPTEKPQIDPPVSSSKKALIRPPLVILVDKQQQLTVAGQALSLPALTEQLSQLQQSHSETDEALSVALKVDKTVTAGQLNDILQTIRNQGIATVTLYSQSVEGV